MQCNIIKAIASVNNKKNLLCQSSVHNPQIWRNSDARLMSRRFHELVYFKIHFRALVILERYSKYVSYFVLKINWSVKTSWREYMNVARSLQAMGSWSKHSYRISGACLYHFHTASYTLSSRLTLRLFLLRREVNWSVVKWTKSFSLATWLKFHSMYSIVFCFSCPRSRSSDNSTNLMQLFALRCSMLKRSQARIASSIYSREWRLKLTRFDDLTHKIFAPMT